MRDIAFRLMMESGVLRPGDREIRRVLDGPATRQEALSHAVEVIFGPEGKLEQQKSDHAKPSPSQPMAFRFSLKGILVWLGLEDQPNGPGPKVPRDQLLVTRLEAQIQKLELGLRTEEARCQTQREELSQLRAQVRRIDVLEAELAIERDSNSRLVHWLQEAEKEVAELRQ
jgi:hypothetical protein